MPFDGSGNVIRTDGTRTGASVWQQARDAGVNVSAPDADIHDEDLATAIENCITRNGENSPSANLPMNAKKHTGVADATQNSEYAAYGQLLALTQPFVGAANVAGTATAITLAPSPAITSYTTGKGFSFFAESASTGPTTVAVGSLSAVSMRRADGTEIADGDWAAGRYIQIIYSGSVWLSNIQGPASGGVGTITSVTGVSGIVASTSDGAVTVSPSLTEANIPNISAAKITSGVLNVNQIPCLPPPRWRLSPAKRPMTHSPQLRTPST